MTTKKAPEPDLGPRGTEIYAALVTPTTDAASKAIALEAARTADRLDDLDQIIQGKGVLKLMMFRILNREIDEESMEMTLNVDVNFQTPLAESRQQATALSGLLKSYAQLNGAVTQPEKPAQPKPAADPADEVRRRREERARARAQ